MIKTIVTAAALALTAVSASAGTDYMSRLEALNAYKAANDGRTGFFTLGKHTNSSFVHMGSGAGFILGNVVGDEDLVPFITDIMKVIDAAKQKGKTVIVASDKWILPSNPVLCEIARQNKMNCADFSAKIYISTSDESAEEIAKKLADAKIAIINLAATMGIMGDDYNPLQEALEILEDENKELNGALDDAVAALKLQADAYINKLTLTQEQVSQLEIALSNMSTTLAAAIETVGEQMVVINDQAIEIAELTTALAKANAKIAELGLKISSLESTIASIDNTAYASEQAAYDAGYSNGHSAGHSAGYSSGHSAGHSAGVSSVDVAGAVSAASTEIYNNLKVAIDSGAEGVGASEWMDHEIYNADLSDPAQVSDLIVSIVNNAD